MQATDIRSLVARHLEAEAAHDGQRAASYYAPDGYYENVPLGLRFAGRDAVAFQYDASYAAMPDGAVAIDGEVVDETGLVHWGTLRAHLSGPFLGLPATGRSVQLPFMARYEVRDGRIRGETLFWDLATFCDQAGLPLAEIQAAARMLRDAQAVPAGAAPSNTQHQWRASELGTAHTVVVDHGRVEYFECGRGTPIVFLHGWLSNANLWRKVVAQLSGRFRCLTVDLPFGSHRVPLRSDADLTPAGCGHLISGLLRALDLREVTLVGNDSGGAYAQIAAAADSERVARLVLNSCETPHDDFPPAQFAVLKALAASPDSLRQALTPLRDPSVRADPRAYGLLVKRPIDTAAWDSYALPILCDDGVLHDASKVMRSAASEDLRAAAARLIDGFERPVLFAWSPEDQIFPIAHAEAYAVALAAARVERIDDAYSFTPEDQPQHLAEAIARFATR
jgi:steroid delta-isomerase-like uncharacterized protein